MISTFADYEAGMEDARAAFNRNPAISRCFNDQLTRIRSKHSSFISLPSVSP